MVRRTFSNESQVFERFFLNEYLDLLRYPGLAWHRKYCASLEMVFRPLIDATMSHYSIFTRVYSLFTYLFTPKTDRLSGKPKVLSR